MSEEEQMIEDINNNCLDYDEEIETGVSCIAYFRTDGGSSKLYTQEYVDDLQNQLQQKENIIKEVREYVEHSQNYGIKKNIYINGDDILEILDKENKDIELDILKALNTDLDDDIEMG